jgi:hypothetical protein
MVIEFACELRIILLQNLVKPQRHGLRDDQDALEQPRPESLPHRRPEGMDWSLQEMKAKVVSILASRAQHSSKASQHFNVLDGWA